MISPCRCWCRTHFTAAKRRNSCTGWKSVRATNSRIPEDAQTASVSSRKTATKKKWTSRLKPYEKGANLKRIYSSEAYNNLDIYQINCTYYSALGNNDAAYLLARAIQCFTRGFRRSITSVCWPAKRSGAAGEQQGRPQRSIGTTIAMKSGKKSSGRS